MGARYVSWRFGGGVARLPSAAFDDIRDGSGGRLLAAETLDQYLPRRRQVSQRRPPLRVPRGGANGHQRHFLEQKLKKDQKAREKEEEKLKASQNG